MRLFGEFFCSLKQFVPLANVRDANYSTAALFRRSEELAWRPLDVDGLFIVELLIPTLEVGEKEARRRGDQSRCRSKLSGAAPPIASPPTRRKRPNCSPRSSASSTSCSKTGIRYLRGGGRGREKALYSIDKKKNRMIKNLLKLSTCAS